MTDVRDNDPFASPDIEVTRNKPADVVSLHPRSNDPGTTAPPLGFTLIGSQPTKPPPEIIKKLLPADGVAVLGGQSSAGKTFLAIHKAICLYTGFPFFGHRISECVGSAFVAAEGRGLIPNRFAAARNEAGVADGLLPIGCIDQLPDFSSVEGIKNFVEQLRKLDKRFRDDYGVRLGSVDIDTVAATFAMKNEDDNAEATKVCNVLRSIGEDVGALMCPVHHYGKNPESGLRGASAWRGSADVILGALADIDSLSGKASNRELVCPKARDGNQGPLSPFELKFVELGQDDDGEPYGSCCVMPKEGGPSRFDKTKKPTKGERAIREAIAECLEGQSTTIVPRAGMPPVKAAKVSDIQIEFSRRYVVPTAEKEKVADAKRKAFKRALDGLPISEFGAGEAQGADWIWKLS